MNMIFSNMFYYIGSTSLCQTSFSNTIKSKAHLQIMFSIFVYQIHFFEIFPIHIRCLLNLVKYYILANIEHFFKYQNTRFLSMKNSSVNVKSSLLLLLAATIWGVAFVAQSIGMEHVGGFTFNSIRSLIGSIVLLPVIFVLEHRKDRSALSENEKKSNQKTLLLGGISCGICLCLATNFQQFGIKYTSVGKAGFITACYIVLVPIFGLFLKKKCSSFVWISVALAVLGLYLLCITDGFSINTGDALVFISSLLFAVHILIVDHFSPLVDGVKLSCIQFFVIGILSGIPALLFEHPTLSAIFSAWMPILYAGAMSCGIAYTLQIIGQKDMNPTIASLILSLESCISVLAGWVILGQNLSLKEGLGCLMMFAAIILAQLPEKKKA